ncbi:MAG: hypothetical protein ACRDYU_03745 [Actinomycetes bacterium]
MADTPPAFTVKVWGPTGGLLFDGQVRADGDYLRLEHEANMSSRVHLRATATAHTDGLHEARHGDQP